MSNKFLPISKEDMRSRGWDELDIIIVTGDAYVDHPSYGASIIGRTLEDAGFRVGIIAQPDWHTAEGFKKLGRPKLFFGVTAGNLDSMVANYTPNKTRRRSDDYSPAGKAGLRPDRATIVYTNRIQEAFENVPVVIGGVEASLRRLAHYDWWSDKVRRSILLDAKADILVYGMGEAQILEIAKRLKAGEGIRQLSNIRGTVIAQGSADGIRDHILIPSYEEVSQNKDKFIEAFKAIYDESDPFTGRPLVQKHGDRFVVQLPPALPLAATLLDKIYLLPYARDWHPIYKRLGGVPGLETVRFSITSHRGCCGACNFCSLYFHQGRIVQSRSEASVVEEIKRLAGEDYFKGTITDIGGPTANLYAASCELWKGKGACRQRRCLVPHKCKNLVLGYKKTLELWDKISSISKVKHVFIGSGVRYDLLIDKESDEYLKALCSRHVSGLLKVAPEHSEKNTLQLMGKGSIAGYDEFVKRFNAVNKKCGKEQYLVNYFLSAHPGCGLTETLELAIYLNDHNIRPEQIQDYLPLPMTASACMYYTGKNPFTAKMVYVAKGTKERRMQRALIQHTQPQHKKLVLEALERLGRLDLKQKLLRPYHHMRKSQDWW